MTHVEFRTEKGVSVAVLAAADYRQMVQELEDASDIAAVARHKAAPARIPGVVVDRLIAGENPVRVWREHRGMTQIALAQKAGRSRGFLSQLESGQREMSITTLKALAQVLNTDMEFLT
jgi:DNA-binding XRE family transcriptional regulator